MMPESKPMIPSLPKRERNLKTSFIMGQKIFIYGCALIFALLTVVACTVKKAAPVVVSPVVLQAPVQQPPVSISPQVPATYSQVPVSISPQVPATYSQVPVSVAQPAWPSVNSYPVQSIAPQFYQTVDPDSGGIIGFLHDNWLALLFGFLGFVEVIIRLTPTETDNSIFNILKRLLDAWFPNVNRAGGTFL
jgi:hypothetical protein